MSVRVLLTAIGCPGGPSIIQALREDDDIFVLGTDMKADPPARYLVDQYVQVPSGRDDTYVPKLLELVRDLSIDVVLPLATFELETLSRSAHLFAEQGVQVCVSPQDSITKANDRIHLYGHITDNTLVPKHRTVTNWEDLESGLFEFGYPHRKVVVRPRISHGSRGFRVVDPHPPSYEQFLHDKPGNPRITLNSLREVLQPQQDLRNLMIMEYLPGKEFGVDLFLDPVSGHPVSIMTRDNGLVTMSSVDAGRIIENTSLAAAARKIAEGLNLRYAVNIDFRLDQENRLKLLEVNPRLPAASFLATTAGLNFPLASVRAAMGRAPTVPSSASISYSIYSYRGLMVVDSEGLVVNRA